MSRVAVALLDDIRTACAAVAAQARLVRIVEEAIEPYARTLPSQSPPVPDLGGASLEERAAFSLTLNAINFGSGWFPTLRKPAGLPGDRSPDGHPPLRAVLVPQRCRCRCRGRAALRLAAGPATPGVSPPRREPCVAVRRELRKEGRVRVPGAGLREPPIRATTRTRSCSSRYPIGRGAAGDEGGDEISVVATLRSPLPVQATAEDAELAPPLACDQCVCGERSFSFVNTRVGPAASVEEGRLALRLLLSRRRPATATWSRGGRLARLKLAGVEAAGDRRARLAVGQPGVARGVKQRFGELVRCAEAGGGELPEAERGAVERGVARTGGGGAHGVELAVERCLRVAPGPFSVARDVDRQRGKWSGAAVLQECGEPVGERGGRGERGPAVGVAGGVAAWWRDRVAAVAADVQPRPEPRG